MSNGEAYEEGQDNYDPTGHDARERVVLEPGVYEFVVVSVERKAFGDSNRPGYEIRAKTTEGNVEGRQGHFLTFNLMLTREPTDKEGKDVTRRLTDFQAAMGLIVWDKTVSPPIWRVAATGEPFTGRHDHKQFVDQQFQAQVGLRESAQYGKQNDLAYFITRRA